MAAPKKRLTDLELEIMQAVWDAHPDPQTVRSVADRLAERGRVLAYTSVQTVMNILRRKGVLGARRGSGRALVYRARVSRAEARSSMTRDLVERAFGGRAETLLAHLLRHESVGREELAELKRRIEIQLEGEDEEEALG